MFQPFKPAHSQAEAGWRACCRPAIDEELGAVFRGADGETFGLSLRESSRTLTDRSIAPELDPRGFDGGSGLPHGTG